MVAGNKKPRQEAGANRLATEVKEITKSIK